MGRSPWLRLQDTQGQQTLCLNDNLQLPWFVQRQTVWVAASGALLDCLRPRAATYTVCPW